MSKLHGHTRITLRNPISGNILKDIESENTFQGNSIAQFVNAFGELNKNPYARNEYQTTRPIWANIVGGLFLFQEQETLGNKFMHAGNKMIGAGSYGFANANPPDELGSFNSAESSASASAITQVYDFATNQANGSISCVCLTSRVGGYIGYGNPSGQWMAKGNRFAIETDQSYVSNKWHYGKGYKKYNFRFDTNNGDLIVEIAKCPVLHGSVFDNIVREKTFDMTGYHNHGANSYIPAWYVGNGKFIIPITDGSAIAVGGNVYYLEFDEDTETISEEKYWTNSSNVALAGGYESIGYFRYDIVIVWGTQNNPAVLKLFNKDTSIQIDSLSFPYRDSGIWFEEIHDGLIIIPMLRTASYNYDFGIYDINNNTIYPINVASFNLNNNVTDFGCITAGGYNNSSKLSNPLYLATINNLSSPVTKTAAQTMKVTYTLTEA